MVTRLLGFMVLLLPLWVQAAVRLELPAQLELGRSVRVTLQADEGPAALGRLSLAPLQAYFRIEELGGISGQGADIRRRLTLLPIRTGPVTLPQWGVSGVAITPPRDPDSGESIGLHFSPPEAEPWQRQALAYRIEVESPQRFIRFDLEEVRNEAWRLQLSPAQVEALAGTRPRYRHRLSLWLIPLKAGQQRLQPPLLKYMHDGVVTHRFLLPAVTLEVRPLPAYLPAATQVGRVEAVVEGPPLHLLRRGEAGRIALQLKGEGVSAGLWSLRLPELLADGTLQPMAAEGVLEEAVGQKALSSRYRLQLPFVTLESGLYTPPPLRLEYFDPTLGKRVTRQLALPRIWVLSPLQRWLLLLMMAGLGYLLLSRAFHAGRAGLQRARLYMQAWHQLQGVEDGPGLRRVQRLLAAAEGWSRQAGVEEWARRWQALVGGPSLAAWSQGLQACCYGPECGQLPQLRQELQAMVRSRLGWRLYLYERLARLGWL